MTSAFAQSKTLVVYYSHTGTTEKLAKRIASATNADIFRLELVKPYSANSQECSTQAKEDAKNNVYRELKAVPDLSKYDTIFIGTPVWSGDVCRPLLGFLVSQNEKSGIYKGKTVIPFLTTWSSGAETTLQTIVDLTKDANHLEGIAQFHGETVDVDAWLEKIFK